MASDELLPDARPDGTRALRRTWAGCAALVVHLRVEGGGHTWPGGHQYLDVDTVGRVSRDFNASEEIVRFFDANPRR
jgi:polyhydroxybutyrate depolymerase